MILIPLQKLPKNVEDLGKLIVAKGLKKLPEVQKIAQSGHTAGDDGGATCYIVVRVKLTNNDLTVTRMEC